MKKLLADKKIVLVIGLLTLLVLVFLVSGLANLAFKPAVPFTVADESTAGGRPWQLPQFSFLIMMILFAALLIAIYFMLPKDQRRRYFSGLIQFVLVGALVLFVLSRSATEETLARPTQEMGTPVQPLAADPTGEPLPEVTPTPFTPPALSPWTSFLVALAVLLPIGVGLWWWLSRHRKDETPYGELAEIAQSALDDLGAGKDWGEAVLNCYYRMTKAVEGQRGLRRRPFLTPSEFVTVLERAHLPGDALRRLTLLFERVRYGGKQSTQKDIDEAVACLTEIVASCREAM